MNAYETPGREAPDCFPKGRRDASGLGSFSHRPKSGI